MQPWSQLMPGSPLRVVRVVHKRHGAVVRHIVGPEVHALERRLARHVARRHRAQVEGRGHLLKAARVVAYKALGCRQGKLLELESLRSSSRRKRPFLDLWKGRVGSPLSPSLAAWVKVGQVFAGCSQPDQPVGHALTLDQDDSIRGQRLLQLEDLVNDNSLSRGRGGSEVRRLDGDCGWDVQLVPCVYLPTSPATCLMTSTKPSHAPTNLTKTDPAIDTSSSPSYEVHRQVHLQDKWASGDIHVIYAAIRPMLRCVELFAQQKYPAPVPPHPKYPT